MLVLWAVCLCAERIFFPQTLLTAVWALTLQFSRSDRDFSSKTCCLFILSLTLKYVLKWTLDFWGYITQMSASLQAALACFNCVCSQQKNKTKQNFGAMHSHLSSCRTTLVGRKTCQGLMVSLPSQMVTEWDSHKSGPGSPTASVWGQPHYKQSGPLPGCRDVPVHGVQHSRNYPQQESKPAVRL